MSRNAKTDESLVCGRPVQWDKSGVGHCWISLTDVPTDVRTEIEGEIIDGGSESCEDYAASNGLHYRW